MIALREAGRRLALGLALAATLLGGSVSIARAADPAMCRPGQDDATERPAPASLLPRLGRAFGVEPDVLRHASYVRCAAGRLMGCMVGANLNCGAADIRRHSRGGDAFCRANPGAAVVPMAATGHATVYDWHCVRRHAVAGRTVTAIDRHGFLAGNWRPVP